MAGGSSRWSRPSSAIRCARSPAGAWRTARSCSAAAASSRPGGAPAPRRARTVVAVTASSQRDGGVSWDWRGSLGFGWWGQGAGEGAHDAVDEAGGRAGVALVGLHGLVGGAEEGGHAGARGVVGGRGTADRSVEICGAGQQGAGVPGRSRGLRGVAGRQVDGEGAGDVVQGGPDLREAAGHRRAAGHAGPAERRGLADALGEQDPGRLPVRQHPVGLVEQLEAGRGRAARVLRARRERGDQVAERLDHLEHQVDARVGEHLELSVGLLGVREEALQERQQDLVGDVEQVHDLSGQRVGDQRDVDVALDRPDVDSDHRADRVEGPVGLAELLELVQDRHELAEVRVPPLPARPLALLQDLVDRPLRGRDVGHRDQFGPAEMLTRGLRPGRADEQPLLAELVRQVRDAGLDGPVQVPDGLEILGARDDLARLHRGHRAAEGGHPVGVLEVHALRALKEHEVAQRLVAERDQGQVHARGIVAGGVREVRPGQVRGAADGGQQVLHQRQVQHLLGGHVRDLLAPSADGLFFCCREALLLRLLQAEGRVQVLAHDPVLELGGLAEQVDQRLAVLDDERGLGRGQAAPRGDHLRQPSPLQWLFGHCRVSLPGLSLPRGLGSRDGED